MSALWVYIWTGEFSDVISFFFFFPLSPSWKMFHKKSTISPRAAHSLHTLSLWLISLSTLPSPAFPDHSPTTHHHPQACQLFAWAVNLNFLVQIHFSCLGTLTKQFLSTDLVPCANVSTDQAHNEMFWMKQPHIKTDIQPHAHVPFSSMFPLTTTSVTWHLN